MPQERYSFAQQKTDIVLNEIIKILKSNNWYVEIENREIFGYKFGNGFDELRISIEYKPENKSHVFKTTVITDKAHIKEINIRNESANDFISAKERVISYILERINIDYGNNSKSKKVYSGSISAGYNRTHDNYRFYPEIGQGSFYMSGSLTYDPAANVTVSSIGLNPADYFSSELYFAQDSMTRENFFNIDLLIYGKNKFNSNQDNTKRSLYGIFNGFEYFRPGYNNSIMQWNRKIYKKQPHIQYVVWRAIQGKIINISQYGNRIFKNYLSIGAGPGINSSLTATDISEQEEGQLSHIFKSIKYRKQNYYYSAAVTANAGVAADKIYNFRFGTDYNFYFFFPVEGEKAFDLMNILKFSSGYYLTENTLLAVNYEFWHIDSKLKDTEINHSWNRLVLEIKYCF